MLVPCNDGSRPDRLLPALESLKPILGSRRLTGLVEPLGFETCSLRLKSEAVAAIAAVGGQGVFKLVHDTFHHRLAGEPTVYPAADRAGARLRRRRSRTSASPTCATGIGGWSTARDRLGNVEQLRELFAGGYDGFVSFEPFAEEVQALADPAAAIRESMAVLGQPADAPAA